MNHTTNYNLNQWEAEDAVRREDFNADNAAIDAALKAVADAAVGNCRLVFTSRVGGGTKDEITITAPGSGQLIAVMVGRINNAEGMIALRGCTRPPICTTSGFPFLRWSGNSMTWYGMSDPSSNFDMLNNTYYIIYVMLPA